MAGLPFRHFGGVPLTSQQFTRKLREAVSVLGIPQVFLSTQLQDWGNYIRGHNWGFRCANKMHGTVAYVRVLSGLILGQII